MINVSGQQSIASQSSAATTSTTASTYVYNIVSHQGQEEHKRRFTEVKQEEKLPENLLGYEV